MNGTCWEAVPSTVAGMAALADSACMAATIVSNSRIRVMASDKSLWLTLSSTGAKVVETAEGSATRPSVSARALGADPGPMTVRASTVKQWTAEWCQRIPIDMTCPNKKTLSRSSTFLLERVTSTTEDLRNRASDRPTQCRTEPAA